jgi:hypothetical protein
VTALMTAARTGIAAEGPPGTGAKVNAKEWYDRLR